MYVQIAHPSATGALILSLAQLYNALWNHISTRPEVSELTIEDPSEHFEDLRDRNDLTRLRKLLGQSKEILSGAPVDKTWMEKTRKELKYAKVCSISELDVRSKG